MEQEKVKYQIAKKPISVVAMRNQRPVDLLCNYIRLGFNPKEVTVKQYSIKFEPRITSDNMTKKQVIIRKLSSEIETCLYPFIQSGDTIFSPKDVNKDIVLTHLYEDGEKYQVTIAQTSNSIDLTKINETNFLSIQLKGFLEVLVKNMISANNGLVRFNKRNIFDYNNVTKMEGNNNS